MFGESRTLKIKLQTTSGFKNGAEYWAIVATHAPQGEELPYVMEFKEEFSTKEKADTYLLWFCGEAD